MRARSARGAVAAIVILAGLLASCTALSSGPETGATTPAAGRTSRAPVPPPELPRLARPDGPEPAVFVSTLSGGVVAVDSDTGDVVRRLTPAREDPIGDYAPVLARGAGAVYFMRPRGLCPGEVWQVPLTGGAAERVFRSRGGHDPFLVASDRSGRRIAIAVQPSCHAFKANGPMRIVVLNTDNGRRASIIFPGKPNVINPGALALTSQWLAFEGSNGAIYLARLAELHGKMRLLDIARPVPVRNRRCSWGTPAWSRTTLFATETCSAGEIGADFHSLARVYQIDLRSRRPIRVGPVVATIQGVNTQIVYALSSDDAGHVIVTRDREQGLDDYVKVDGMRTTDVPDDSCYFFAQVDPCGYASW